MCHDEGNRGYAAGRETRLSIAAGSMDDAAVYWKARGRAYAEFGARGYDI
jgi:hypothetical protein